MKRFICLTMGLATRYYDKDMKMKKIIQSVALFTTLLFTSSVFAADVTIYHFGPQAASNSLSGTVELATTAETNTGNDTGRVPSVDALAGSIIAYEPVEWVIFDTDDNTTIVTGTEAYTHSWTVDMELKDVVCSVTDLNSASGGSTVVNLSLTSGGSSNDMLSVGVTIPYGSYGAHSPTIDDNHKTVTLYDQITWKVTSITSGHPHVGLTCAAIFGRP